MQNSYKPQLSNSYRPDIDGLRALAIISIVVFHFNKTWLPGGFVGVDIFFVISGFLITKIIQNQMIDGRFSFASFYARRARRIFPATLFLVLFTLFVGIIFLLPSDIKKLCQAAIAASLSSTNIYYWKFLDTSYFAPSSELLPLLHLWSLGVEEQFYLIWPLTLVLLHRTGGKLLGIGTLILASISFVISAIALKNDSVFAFYMLPSRMGEFLAGGSLCTASILLENKKIPSWVYQITAISGLLLIVWSLCFLNEKTGFPGLISIVPTLGSMLLIISGNGSNLLTKLLSLKPIVAIGLLSFSLYLWHWPILAFYRYAYVELDLLGYFICLGLITIFSIFSYYFIETKFRYNQRGFILPAAGFSAALLILIIVPGCYFNSTGGFISQSAANKFILKARAINALKAPAYTYPYNCQDKPEKLKDVNCILGPTNVEPRILLWGDSHAAHYVGYLKILAEHYRVGIRNFTRSSCIPFFVNTRRYVNPALQASCENYHKVIQGIISQYDTIIVGASWLNYNKGDSIYKKDMEVFIDELSRTGKNVIIALDVPKFPKYDQSCELKSTKIPRLDCEKMGQIILKEDYEINKYIVQLASKYKNVSTFSLRQLICKKNTCSVYFGGNPIYFDTGHLSMAGSTSLGETSLKKHIIPDNIRSLFLV
ncbi:acyltransferase family protein [Legionella qingyii]|uniref:acyltransferase family protein n=1 Tax=Legionella qingyii TaxID=2184757 RepID=UPI0013159AD3|nr:acyltransferase family protein [Legionella qingyii]